MNHGSQDLTLAASRALGISVVQAEERKRKLGLNPTPPPPGANPTAAKLSGIDTERTTIGVYIFSGVCASIAAVFISSRMMTAMPELGIGSEMDVIASVVIGGTAFSGGTGDVWGTMLGALFLALIKNGILKTGISPWVQPIAIGGIIVVTVIVDVWQKRASDRRVAKAKLRRLEAEAAAAAATGQAV